MNTLKIWKGHDKTDTKIIAFFDNTIYLGNPKSADVDNVISNTLQSKDFTQGFTGIPIRYIKEIHLEEAKDFIEIQFGSESTEIVKLKDKGTLLEIFEYLKTHIPNTTFVLDKYSKLRAGKKPLMAMGVVSAIFIWTLYVSNGFDQGYEYEVVGNQRSLASIVLGIASLGAKKVIIIFGVLFTVSAISFYFKTRVDKVVQKIIIRR